MFFFQILPAVLMVTLYVGIIIFLLVLAWRGVRAHESLAASVERIAAQLEASSKETPSNPPSQGSGDGSGE